MKYRPEIDGLRAVAVLPVILFHAGFSVFGGGFVGVDIFFVISGFLITTILLEDLQQDRFSILDFYERRIRRILPALFFVMLVCLPFAWAWLLPEAAVSFSRSLIGVTLFISNLVFERESSYFAPAMEVKPLLHTWSLSVEEQFYLVFPVVLLFAFKFMQSRLLHLFVFFIIIGVMLSEWGWRNDPTLNFYLSLTRAWEFYTGSIAALIVLKRGVLSNNFLSMLGLACIIASIFFYTEAIPFPSIYTLLPVCGAALIILYAGEATLVAILLRNKVLVFIGLISFSAYLWHQPLFAFARIRSFEEPSHVLMGGLSIISVGLAVFSWRFIEKPFRQKNNFLKSRRMLFSVSLSVSLMFIVLGVVGYLNDGFPKRLPKDVVRIGTAGEGVSWPCDGASFITCTIGDKGVLPNIALIGDSHAARYAFGFDQVLMRNSKSMQVSAGGWCVPLLDFVTSDIEKNSVACENGIGQALRSVAKDSNIDVVILSAEWANYTKGYRWGDLVSAYSYRSSENNDPRKNPKEFRLALSATVKLLQENSKKIIIIDPTPEFKIDVPRALAAGVLFDKDLSALHISEVDYLKRNEEYFNILNDEEFMELERISVSQYFCNEDICSPYSPDFLPYFSDPNHLSAVGTKLVSEAILNEVGLN